MPLDDIDLAEALDTEDGEAVIGYYTPFAYIADHPDVNKTKEVEGMWASYTTVDNGMEMQKPAFLCLLSKVSDATRGALIRIDNEDYEIKGFKKTGTGFALLKLEGP